MNSLLIVALGIGFLVLLMATLKLNAFLALIITSLVVGVAEGMEPTEALRSVKNGVGSTLGGIALVLAYAGAKPCRNS